MPVEGWPTRAWADVRVGDEIGAVEMEVTMRRLMVDVAGTRDLYPIHHDRDFARSNRARDIFLNTMFYEGLFGRLATDWAGPEAFLRALRFTMAAPNCLGDTIRSRGWVTRTHADADGRYVDLEIHLDNQLGPSATVAHLTVELPG